MGFGTDFLGFFFRRIANIGGLPAHPKINATESAQSSAVRAGVSGSDSFLPLSSWAGPLVAEKATGGAALSRISVLLAGTLTGMGRSAPCEMIAVKSPAGNRGEIVYSGIMILRAPSNLPFGDYTLTFGNVTVAARRVAESWTVQNEPIPARIVTESASGEPADGPRARNSRRSKAAAGG